MWFRRREEERRRRGEEEEEEEEEGEGGGSLFFRYAGLEGFRRKEEGGAEEKLIPLSFSFNVVALICTLTHIFGAFKISGDSKSGSAINALGGVAAEWRIWRGVAISGGKSVATPSLAYSLAWWTTLDGMFCTKSWRWHGMA